MTEATTQKTGCALAAAAFFGLALSASQAEAQAEAPILGQIMPFPYEYCPRGWAPTRGQILQIAQNQRLYSLIGTTFGGDGRVTFALPDLRSRSPTGIGAAPGSTPRKQGEKVGAETAPMTADVLANHAHSARATIFGSVNAASAESPEAALTGETSTPIYVEGGAAAVPFADGALTATLSPQGGGQPISILQPTLVIQYCIALDGIFPSRP